MKLLYNIVLHLLGIGFLPKMAFEALTKKKYRNSFFQKFGKGFPKIEKGKRKLIWAHAVSVGETLGIAPLIRKFKEEFPDCLIVLSTTTETGHATGKKSVPEADFHVYLPFDLPYIINPIVRRLAPDLVILMETDLWYNFLTAAKQGGAKLAVVNGKLSERSFKRLSFFRKYAYSLFTFFNVICIQGQKYFERFQALGIPKNKLVITGNLKLSSQVVRLSCEDVNSLKEKYGLKDHLILILGSTHDPEEKIWFSHLPELWKEFSNLKVLLAPRHPERLKEISSLLTLNHIPFDLWSSGKSEKSSKVILIDQMGLLRTLFQIGDLAFVGGSLTEKVGGHNIIEPCFYGVPVLYGPHMEGQPDFLALMEYYVAGEKITEKTLPPITKKFLASKYLRQKVGTRGEELVAEQGKALESTFQYLLPLFRKNSA